MDADPAENGVSDVEQMLVRTRREADLLAVALVRAPFDPVTVEELRRYLEQDAGPAQEAYETLRSLSPQVLQARVEELTRASRAASAQPDGRVSS